MLLVLTGQLTFQSVEMLVRTNKYYNEHAIRLLIVYIHLSVAMYSMVQ